MTSPEMLLTELVVLKDTIAMFEKRKKAIEDQLVKDLQGHGRKTVSSHYAGDQIKGTLVEAERVSIDPDKLKKGLNAPTWDKVTSKVLDKDKLEAAVAMGIVDAQIVAAASEVKKSKPFIKVSGAVPVKDIVAQAEGGSVKVTTAQGKLKPAAKRVVRAKPRASS